MTNSARHIPVMLNEVLAALAPKNNEIYVDATFGNGGYSEAILNAAQCKVIAIDRDPSVKTRADELKKLYGNRFEFRAGAFGEMADIIDIPVNGVVFDIGVSSMQLDDDFRGFSFSKEAPLDMRMSMSGLSAKDIVNQYSEVELADLIYLYGEERRSRQIAQKIVEYRTKKPIETTTELAQIIYQVMPKHSGQIDPATRTFQALRIAVNDELKQLERGLEGALSCTKPEGRIVVVDFHSLEDRIAKNFFSENSDKKVHVSRYKQSETESIVSDKLLAFVSKVIMPTENEIRINPRSRSAKLRYAIKRKEL
jgi:16S rRNA (cytosine1402-N4)-methyltransferase